MTLWVCCAMWKECGIFACTFGLSCATLKGLHPVCMHILWVIHHSEGKSQYSHECLEDHIPIKRRDTNFPSLSSYHEPFWREIIIFAHTFDKWCAMMKGKWVKASTWWLIIYGLQVYVIGSMIKMRWVMSKYNRDRTTIVSSELIQ